MRIYCLCKTAPALNRVIGVGNRGGDPHTHVVLAQRMEMQECGAEQFIEAPEGMRQHFPNVDLYVCQNCGTIVAHE